MYDVAVSTDGKLRRTLNFQVDAITDHDRNLTKRTAFRLIPTKTAGRRMSRKEMNLKTPVRVFVFASKQPILNPLS